MFGIIFTATVRGRSQKNELSSWEIFIPWLSATVGMIALEQQHALKFDQEEALKLTDLIAISIDCICLRKSHQKVLFPRISLHSRLHSAPEG